jgi:hypothetical protein
MKKNEHSKVEQIESLAQLAEDKVNDEVVEFNSFVIDESFKYKSSKSNKIPHIILFSILLIPFGFAFSFLYAYLTWYNPFTFLDFIIVAVFGVILGFILPVKLSKCTNSKVAIISAIIFAFICHYFGWVVWMDLYINQTDVIEINHPKSPISSIVPSTSDLDQIFILFTNPSILFSILQKIAKDGYFSIFSYMPKGFSLYLIWFLEMATVLFLSAFASYERSNEPFSVEKNKWLKSFDIKLSYIGNLNLLKQAILDGDKSFFDNLDSPDADSSFSEFKIWHIDDDQAYITIKNKERQIDENGKTKFEEKELVKYVKINQETLKVFLNKSANSVI